MDEYETILLATDGSEGSRAAREHALVVAASTDATLHTVSVVETRTAYDNAIVDPDEVRENLRSDAQAAVDAVADAAADAGVACRTNVAEGPPPERLLEAVEAVGGDLVVVGATGRSSFKRLVLGSTAEHLLESSPVPVVVVG